MRSLPTALTAAIVVACSAPLFTLPQAARAQVAPPGPLQLKPEQIKKLGIQLQAVAPAAAQGRLQLQGLVVLPPHLVRVMSAPVAALVEQVQVSKGERLRAGQPLLKLQAPQVLEWQRDHQQALLQRTLARQTAERDAALLAEGIVPASRAQASQAQLKMAEALVQERSQQLQAAGVTPQARLTGQVAVAAPAASTVVEVLVQAGQRVDAGAPLMTVAAAGALDLEMQATVDEARQLAVGDEVSVAGCATPARISAINTRVEDAGQTVAVRARWPQAQPCVWPQQRVPADVALHGGAGAWRVPAAAVVRHEGEDWVFVRRQPGQFQPVSVRVTASPAGAAGSAAVLVTPRTAGRLQAQDQVVSQGAVALKGMLQGLGAE